MNLVGAGSFLGLPPSRWIGALLDLLFRGTLRFALTCVALRLIGRRSAAWRSRRWTVAFLLLVALPLGAAPLVEARQEAAPRLGHPLESEARPALATAPIEPAAFPGAPLVEVVRETEPELALFLARRVGKGD